MPRRAGGAKCGSPGKPVCPSARESWCISHARAAEPTPRPPRARKCRRVSRSRCSVAGCMEVPQGMQNAECMKLECRMDGESASGNLQFAFYILHSNQGSARRDLHLVRSRRGIVPRTRNNVQVEFALAAGRAFESVADVERLAGVANTTKQRS